MSVVISRGRDEHRERAERSKPLAKRPVPFLSLLLVAWVVVPAMGTVWWLFGVFDRNLIPLIIWLCAAFSFVLSGAAVGIGYKVTKRLPFVVWHVVATVCGLGIFWSVLVWLGWSRWLLIVYLFASLAVAGSWSLYRVDALRSAAKGDSDGGGGLADLLGWPKGAKVRQGSIEADEYAVTAVIDHDAVPANQVANALPVLVEKSGAVRGRSTIIPGERGGSSTVRLVHTDPFKDWRVWPGLSHPGLSFAYPFRTAYYTTGEVQWYSFAQTPDRNFARSQVAKKFRSPNDAHLGRQGATRAGKSGDTAIEIAEALSRRDCIVALVNTAKLMQDSAWCLDHVALAADTKPKSRVLFDALRSLGEYRSNVMGDRKNAGKHRTWTPDAYTDLGFAALLVEVDEGDQVLSGADVTWLTTKGLSLGIFVSASISRAVTDGMASTLRSAVTQWKCFGAGQSYDKGFALSDETIAAGAAPETFGTRFPGAHYLDKAQGVPETLYPIDARSFKTERDFSDLRREVDAARATFTPATFTPGEIKVLGDAFRICAPQTLLFGVRNADDDPPGEGPRTETDEETATMAATLDLRERSDSGDPELDELMEAPREDFTDLTREYGELPPPNEGLPAPPPSDGSVVLESGKPKVSPEQTVAEFDAALIRLAERGVTEFGLSDVVGEMKVDIKAPWVSKRFTRLCDGEDHLTQPPPGLAVERLPAPARGRFLLIRMTRGHDVP